MNACGPQKRLLALAPYDESNSSAGLQDAAAFAKRFHLLRKKHDAEAAGHRVERLIRKRQRLYICNAKLHIPQSFLFRQFLRKSDHAGTKIRCDDVSGQSHRFRNRQSRIAHAARQIEHLHSRAQPGRFKDRCGYFARENAHPVIPLPPGGNRLFIGPLLPKFVAKSRDLDGIGGAHQSPLK
jgi:hypothetical protein